jgi:hypothetical protein
MTNVYVAKVDWTGTYGHTGISRFAFERADHADVTRADVDSMATAIDDLFGPVMGWFPIDVSYTIDSIVEYYDGVLGTLLGEVAATSAHVLHAGGADGAYGNGIGALLKWNTGGLFDGHRIRGRTYMVPLGSVAFQTDGVLKPDCVSSWLTGAAAYLAAMATAGLSPLVWGHPRDVPATLRTPAHHAAGHWASILTAAMDEKPAILGRRR